MLQRALFYVRDYFPQCLTELFADAPCCKKHWSSHPSLHSDTKKNKFKAASQISTQRMFVLEKIEGFHVTDYMVTFYMNSLINSSSFQGLYICRCSFIM